ncbi:hypothetical protein A3F08_01220 [Candidatus Berkelbacteria bacterium RIFCSPHIGHO2_12_FULL_36_9]|uniref:CYTH domain-containing protein n=1 Tax=Candidatus Berkelbacteria bacterium RIFCSPHIGHO2_12_FULL_36_9 TaxID=1797469 RepID=A0A1F5EG98_9BACT|nr:MAG: hypothetical protein A3F08_01220 [Candidatus Berkelbacteria bacterium RIFCSPHIGHO2_12_FULL_36_9]
MKEIEYKFVLKSADKTRLEKFLKKSKAKLTKSETQDNWYYVAPGKNDLRIRRNDKEAFLILKKGWMHDTERDEIEVKVTRPDFERLDEIFVALGYKYDTKWYRKRLEYKLKSFNITIDFNAGYGGVAEIEKVVKNNNEVEKAKKDISDFAKEVGIEPATKELFNKMYTYYKKNWKKYYTTKTTFDINKLK